MTGDAWIGDWRERLRTAVARKGMSSVTEFARSLPWATYEMLSKELGSDIAPAQMEALLQEEAAARGDVLSFLMDGLTRNLREYLPDGWGVGPEAEFRAARAYSMWVSSLGEELEARGREAWRRLRSFQPPTGWVPTASDPLLEAAFSDQN